ncbi:MFS-type transporter SLC18B1 [Geodia barretti]|nr:MFS-type transporter SLC18B1 [Geodia barretti]
MEKQLPASLSRQHSVNALMIEREATSPRPPQQQSPAADEEEEKTPLLQGKSDLEGVSTKKGTGRWNLRTLTLLVVLWIACILISSCYSMIAPFFPHEAQKKGCSLLVVGVILSASPFCVFTTSPIFGYLLPKLGIRFSMIFGFLLVGVAFILLGFLQDLPDGWLFIVAATVLRMTEGIGSSLAFTGMYTLLPVLFPSRVGLVMGVFEVGSGLGFAVGPPIGGLLYTVGGFMLPFVSVGATVLLIIPPTFLLYKKTSCQPKVISFGVIRRLSGNFVFVLLLISQVICLTALGFLNPTFQPFLHKQFGLDELQVGLVFICAPAMYMILAAIFGALADKFGPRGFIVSGFLISGVSFFLIGPATFITTPRLWLTIVASLLMGVGLAPAFIPSYSDLLKIAK